MKKLLLTAMIAAMLIVPFHGVAMARNQETSPEAPVSQLDAAPDTGFVPGDVPAQTDAAQAMTPAIHAMMMAMFHYELDSFDFAVSRAVASLEVLSELCLPYVKVGGRFLAMKSVDSAGEVDRAARAIARLGGRLLPRVDYEIPGAGVKHRVVVVEKVSLTPQGYPRRWARIQKTPL